MIFAQSFGIVCVKVCDLCNAPDVQYGSLDVTSRSWSWTSHFHTYQIKINSKSFALSILLKANA